MNNKIDTDSWIKRELALALNVHESNLTLGADINFDGNLQPNERILDFNDNNYVGDAEDWQTFFENNSTSIYQLGGFFEWGKAFNPANPIHDAMSIEREVVGDESVKHYYDVMGHILIEQKTPPSENPLSIITDRLISAMGLKQEPFNFLNTLIAGGISIETGKGIIFTESLQNKQMDCDDWSFAFLCIGVEMEWPIRLVAIPGHIYVRWDEQDTHQNYDINGSNIASPTDKEYVDKFDLPDNSPMFTPLDSQGLKSLFYANRGLFKQYHSNYQGALRDFDKAIALNPTAADNYYRRGNIKFGLHNDLGAIDDYNEYIKLDPNSLIGYIKKSEVEFEMGEVELSIQTLRKGLSVDPDYFMCGKQLNPEITDKLKSTP